MPSGAAATRLTIVKAPVRDALAVTAWDGAAEPDLAQIPATWAEICDQWAETEARAKRLGEAVDGAHRAAVSRQCSETKNAHHGFAVRDLAELEGRG